MIEIKEIIYPNLTDIENPRCNVYILFDSENSIDVADGEEIYKIEKDLNYDLNRESFNMEVFKNTFERRFVLLSNLFWKSKEISI